MPLTNDDRTLLNEILTRLVRLEWRLETAGVLTGGNSYADDVLRHALENNIEITLPEQGPVVTEALINEIEDRLDAMELGKEPLGFYELERRLDGAGGRGEIIAALKNVKLQGRFVNTIERLAEEGNPPVEAHGLAHDPYERERNQDA